MEIQQGGHVDPKDPRYWVTSRWTKEQLDKASIEVSVEGEPSFTAPMIVVGRSDGRIKIVIDADLPTPDPLTRAAVKIYATQSRADSIIEHPDQKRAKFKLVEVLRSQ